MMDERFSPFGINWSFTPQLRCTSGVPNPAAIRAHWEYMIWPPSPQVCGTAPIYTPLVVHSDSLQSNGYLTMVTDDGVAEYLQPFPNPSDAGGSVSVELSTDNGTTWTTVAASAPNTGTFALTLPNTPTIGARVRVSSTADPSISTIGAPFTIAAAKRHQHHHHHRHHELHHADDDEHSGAKRPRHHESVHHSEHPDHEPGEHHHDHDD
jgi:hypothetical protein